ncbi:hypothetical protein AOLI_G00259720 [Acnodon oligacanthus]
MIHVDILRPNLGPCGSGSSLLPPSALGLQYMWSWLGVAQATRTRAADGGLDEELVNRGAGALGFWQGSTRSHRGRRRERQRQSGAVDGGAAAAQNKRKVDEREQDRERERESARERERERERGRVNGTVRKNTGDAGFGGRSRRRGTSAENRG